MITLAEIIRRHGAEYRARFAADMPLDQLAAMLAIVACRTPALGGQRWHCPACGEDRFSYHSCGNRHCPACGHDDAQLWLNRQQALLLPVTYHVPVHALSAVFRARFRDALKKDLPAVFAEVPAEVWKQDWVVHSKPVGRGEKALLYLSRYIYRVALNNRHILSADAQAIRFRYRRSEDGQPRVASLPPLEFLRRFLQHVLPSHFVKVRHFGLHHPSRRPDLSLMRASLYLSLNQPVPVPPPPPDPKPCLCPKCSTPMVFAQTLKPFRHASPRGPP